MAIFDLTVPSDALHSTKLSHRRGSSDDCEREEDTLVLRSRIVAKKQKVVHLSRAEELPDDVWFRIMELAYSHHFPQCHTADSMGADNPVRFTHVSRRFRALGLGLPTIWSCVHVMQLVPGRGSGGVESLKQQLLLSGSRPLDVVFIWHGGALAAATKTHRSLDTLMPSDSDDFAYYRDCWGLVLAQASRWRRFAFHSSFHGFASRFLTNDVFGGDLSLPLLEHMDVYVDNDSEPEGEGDEVPQTWNLADLDAPHLTCFRAHRVQMQLNDIPHFMLTELVLHTHPDTDGTDTRDLVNLLNAMSDTLTTLVLCNTIFDEELFNEDLQDELGALPHLKYLFLGDVGSIIDQNIVILQYLLDAAPHLLRLDIDSYTSVGYLCLDGAYPSVQMVGLNTHEESANEDDEGYQSYGRSFLEMFPSLKHLILADDDCTAHIETLYDVSQEAAAEDHQVCRWPSLEKLTLTSDSTWESPESCQMLADFASLRHELGRPLRVVEMRLDAFNDETLKVLEDDVADVKQIEEGLASQIDLSLSNKRWGTRDHDRPIIPVWECGSSLEV